MADKKDKSQTRAAELPPPETQKQRWVKYGANVALSIVLTVVIAGLVTYLAQRFNRRVDTTFARVYSLKPQTEQIIGDLEEPVRLISLYSRTPAATLFGSDADEKTRRQQQEQLYETVRDLLQEYDRASGKIQVELVDPVENPARRDELVTELAAQYGGNTEPYKQFFEAYRGGIGQVEQIVAQQVAQIATLPLDQIKDRQYQESLVPALQGFQDLPAELKRARESVDRRLNEKIPDYRAAADSARNQMQTLSSTSEAMVQLFEKFQDDAKLPETVRQYLAGAKEQLQQLKKTADDVAAKEKDLGELKLDTLREQLGVRDSILVVGPKDVRVIRFDDVWPLDKDLRTLFTDAPTKPRFAGEQQITTAILAVKAQTKGKVVFVRPGGAPLTQSAIPGFRAGGPLSSIANRLRDYNFEVLEKDLSGSWAMQAQMRGGMPPEPEPDDEQIKDAVWIVLALPQGQMGPMGMPTPMSPKVKEHLDRGGSALVLVPEQGDKLEEALGEWGVEVLTDVIAVHEKVEAPQGPAGDYIENIQRMPFVFFLTDYGDHPLARPLKSLESLMAPLMVVKTTPRDGYAATPLLPVPQVPPAWGERNFEAAMAGDEVKFDANPEPPAQADVPPPIFGGAAVEKKDAGRLVVIGAAGFATNGMLSLPDPQVANQRGIAVPRFPGNAELVLNSVFWLAKMDTMLAISPAAMEVARIDTMSPGKLAFWRVGIPLVLLPLLVVGMGLVVWLKRRD